MTTSQKRQYASGTYVGIGRSKDEIQAELVRMGASKRLFYDDDEAHHAVVSFERAGVRYRITLSLRDPATEVFRYTPARRFLRDAVEQRAAWLQDCNERWRALAAYIKALRDSAEAGITTVETVLQPFAVVPASGGRTVQEWVGEQLPQAYARGEEMPPLLPGLEPPNQVRVLPPGPGDGE
jgi:hypothetical protein